jgi:predicted ferric reductase
MTWEGPFFSLFSCFYECYLSKKHGRITAAYINERIKEGLQDKYIFMCGPSPMIESLKIQFKKLGVKEHQFIVEDFNLFESKALTATSILS